jgi:Tfp pilus assembly protein PilF
LKAIELYREALVLDPKFALACGGIALAYFQLADLNFVQWKEAADSVRRYAITALEFDPELAEPHIAIGMIRYNNYEIQECKRELKRAIEINPLCADAIHVYAHVLSERGYPDEGINLMRQSAELEPLSAHYQYCLATAYGKARRWDEALAESEKVKSLDSTWSSYRNDNQMGNLHLRKGMYDKAVECARKFSLHSNTAVPLELMLAKVCAANGDVRGLNVSFGNCTSWDEWRTSIRLNLPGSIPWLARRIPRWCGLRRRMSSKPPALPTPKYVLNLTGCVVILDLKS